MRCIKCNVDTKLKQLDGTDRRCPSCGHRFVADKKTHGIVDQGIQKAIDRVSDKGTRFYLTSQLEYELCRRLNVRSGPPNAAAYVGAVFSALVSIPFFIGGAAMILSGSGFVFLLGFLMAFIGAMILFKGIKKLSGGMTPDQLGALLGRFEEVNLPEYGVPSREEIARQMQQYQQEGPHPAWESVLVCQHPRMVDFFCANKFYLHHPCAVAGPEGYGLDFFPGALDQIRIPGSGCKILVLHDYSPKGRSFYRSIEANPSWLQFSPDTQVVDIGLSDEHRVMFQKTMRPVSEIDGGRTRSRTAVKGRDSKELGAEVFAVAPLLMMTAAGAAVDEGAMMHLPEQTASRDGGG